MGSLEQSSKTIRVSALQWTPVKGDVLANWAIVEQMLDDLRGQKPDLVVLPEMAITGYIWRQTADIQPLATQCSSEDSHRQWVATASRHNVWLVVGHPAVDADSGSLRNRCTLVSPDGVVGHYDKTLLFAEDTYWATAGTLPPPVWETPWGGISPLICADIDYPEPYSYAASVGADLVVLPTAWVEEPAPSPAWMMRAFETGVPLVAADVFGVDEGAVFPGGSCIIDSNGTVVSSLGYEQGSVTADIVLEPTRTPTVVNNRTISVVSLPEVTVARPTAINVQVAGPRVALESVDTTQLQAADIVVVPAVTVNGDASRREALQKFSEAAENRSCVVVGSVINQTTGLAEVVTSYLGEPCKSIAHANTDSDGVWRGASECVQVGMFTAGELSVAIVGAWELARYWPVRALASHGVHVVLATGPTSLLMPHWRAASEAPFELPLGGEEDYFAHPARLRAGENNVWLAFASNTLGFPSGVFAPNHVWWPRREVLATDQQWATVPCSVDQSDSWVGQVTIKPMVSSRRSDLYPDVWTWRGE